jgi:magnesium chelatase family protein
LYSLHSINLFNFDKRIFMSLAIVYSRACAGVAAPLVTVEIHIARGMRKFFMVGLAEAAVKESRDRVRSAILNSHFDFPAGRITVNLAPADLPKEGGRFDLPIALGILAASGQLSQQQLSTCEFIGELALTGEIRPVRGVLPLVLSAKLAGRKLIIPDSNAQEAALVKNAEVYSATHLLEVCSFLNGRGTLPLCDKMPSPEVIKEPLDFSDVYGQAFAKRALEIAAAGKHSVLLIGPPGTGKTMLASRLTTILPRLDEQQALESAAIASISTMGFDVKLWQRLPFRAPHHTSSSMALVGGGRPPKPGEISLAHHGVLFLDELPEFNRHLLESLREPLESGIVTISRAAYQTMFPAQFQLIAAMNPCPCGYAGSVDHVCQCSEEQIKRYLAKLSGPLIDRIDMQVQVPAIAPIMLSDHAKAKAESSAAILVRVMQARHVQWQRQQKLNSELSVRDLEAQCHLAEDATVLLNQVMNKFKFSARVYHRILKLSRTIADMEASITIKVEHVSEALTYRCLDRNSISLA